MLRHPTAPHRGGRSADLLKVKSARDDEVQRTASCALYEKASLFGGRASKSSWSLPSPPILLLSFHHATFLILPSPISRHS
eukprot:3009156-Pleurochrysis_carterae.AAC.1